jgi:hypothetical protein
LWHYHFGRGIVASPSDFGHTGIAPTHPELLDYLASELTSGDWQLKRLHRLMMTTAAYRQSSRILDFGLPILDSEEITTAIQNPKSKIPNSSIPTTRSSGVKTSNASKPRPSATAFSRRAAS